MKRYILIGLLLFSACALAQTDSLSNTQIREVYISAFHINDSLLNAPAAIGIVSKSDLQKNNNAEIVPAINRIPGVLMQSGSYNTNRISIRGIGARTPYGTNKIRAFYGTIPLTSGDSETTIEDIDIENINQVEIIKGPLSSVYGAGLGGAILLEPKLYENPGHSAQISTTHGSFGLVKTSAAYSVNTKSGSLNLSYHKLESDGWRDNSSYRREGITLAGELFRKKKSKLTYFGNYTYLKAFIPSSIDKETFDNNPKAAAFTWNAAKGYEQYDSFLGGLAFDWMIIGNLKNSTSVFVNHKESDEPRPFDILRQNTTGYGARTQFSGSLKIGTETKFIFGGEYFRDGFKGKTLENLYEQNNGMGSLPGVQLSGSEQKRSFSNAFAQLRMLLGRKFEIQGGLNINKTEFELDNTFPTETTSSENYSYDAIWSPQLSVLYKPVKGQTIYASASRGFSMPAIEETLKADGTINPNIKPENGYNFEIGGKFYFLDKSLFAEIALYRMEIKDLLVAQRIGDDQYVGVNAGKTLHQGIEITLNYNKNVLGWLTLNPFLAVSAGEYKFEEFITNDTDFSGNELTGVPKNKINAGLVLNSRFGVYISGDFQFVDELPLNDANSVYNDAYRIWNLKAGYKFEIWKGFTSHLSAGVNNIFDEKYAAMVLVNATAFGNATPRFYYPGLPVNYYANLSFQYLF